MSYTAAIASGAVAGAVFGTEGLARGVSELAHRQKTHGSIELSPAMEHYARFRLWTTTGQKVREWVAVHRKHHEFSDVEGDPHSPVLLSQRIVKWKTAFLYREALEDPALIQEYAPELKETDALDRLIYDKGLLGVLGVQPVMIGSVLRAKGYAGGELAVGTVAGTLTSLFIALRAGGEVNATSHQAEERHPETHDFSSNLGEGEPGLLGRFRRLKGAVTTAGEAVGHHNHHKVPYSAIFHETLDPVGYDIKLLSKLGLVRIVHVSNDVDPDHKLPRAAGEELQRLEQITPTHALAA